jgi:hypothetical protein
MTWRVTTATRSPRASSRAGSGPPPAVRTVPAGTQTQVDPMHVMLCGEDRQRRQRLKLVAGLDARIGGPRSRLVPPRHVDAVGAVEGAQSASVIPSTSLTLAREPRRRPSRPLPGDGPASRVADDAAGATHARTCAVSPSIERRLSGRSPVTPSVAPVLAVSGDPDVDLDKSVGTQCEDASLSVRADLDQPTSRSIRRCRDTVGWVNSGSVATKSPAVHSPRAAAGPAGSAPMSR